MSCGLMMCPGGRTTSPAVYVLADLHHVLAGRHRAHHLNGAIVDLLGVFNHHYGIGVQRQHPAGVGQSRLADAQRNRRLLTHRHFAHHAEPSRQPVGCAVGVGRAHAVSVHAGPSKRRQRFRSDHGLGDDATQRIRRKNRFRAGRSARRQLFQQQGQCFSRWQYVKKLWHRKCDASRPPRQCQKWEFRNLHGLARYTG